MQLIQFLLAVPLLAAILVAVAPGAGFRGILARFFAVLVAAGSVFLCVQYYKTSPLLFKLGEHDVHLWDKAFTVGSVLLTLLILFFCRKITRKEWYIPVLVVLQTGLLLGAEYASTPPKVEYPFYLDTFSILMALIIGIVGGLICIHAVRYMKDYHKHAPAVPDRQRSFFFVLFLFLSAMFGIVFSNHLIWLFFFWEVTTVCSFWMISYSGTPEAVRNGFRALGLNLLGGVFFAAGILWLTRGPGLHAWSLSEVIAAGRAAALVPAVLIAIAGLTKSAQLPFSSWLLGAMVAPTPVSALLHSSTMVKAGVFILVKFSPVFHGTVPGLLIALVGGVTFLVSSMVAVNQSNAKLVLAHSTIANLGLIVMCTGLDAAIMLWAAILLILFHALAKALLFLGVGTTEHLIGSRDIEDMGGLVYRRPFLTILIMVGILGMFLAPFGMLISKYTCFKAFLTTPTQHGGGPMLGAVLAVGGVALACILALGSAPTLFFWSKWLGKLVARPPRPERLKQHVPRDEFVALFGLGLLSYAACALFPLADTAFIQPYTKALVDQGLLTASLEKTPVEAIIVMAVMLAGLALMPLRYALTPPKYVAVSTYLAGANVDGSASYQGAMGAERTVVTHNYYLTSFINGAKLTKVGGLAASAVIVLTLAATAL